jgi:hypothetical protein
VRVVVSVESRRVASRLRRNPTTLPEVSNMRNRIAVPLILGLALLLAVAPTVAKKRDLSAPLVLEFVPQDTTGGAFLVLSPAMTQEPVSLGFGDQRNVDDPMVVGQGMDDDDRTFPVRADSDPVRFAQDVLVQVAGEWGLRWDENARRSLEVNLVRFFVRETDQAVGSNYTAETGLSFALRDAKGGVLAEGTSRGDARRYGKSGSHENMNEVLSDALKEAYGRLLDNRDLRAGWAGETTAAPAAAAVAAPSAAAAAPSGGLTPSRLLAEVVKLQDSGVGTDILVEYVGSKQLATAFSADDILAWKNAGVPEEVIKTAMSRTP